MALVGTACTGETDPGAATSNSTPTTSEARSTTTAGVSTNSTTAPFPVLDLTDRPFIIFAPIPPQPEGKDLPIPSGSDDYYELFEPGAAWERAAAEIDAFKVHAWQVRHYFTDDQLRTIIENLRERGIPLAMEMEPLEVPDPDECAQTESFEGTYDLEMAQKIKDLGGEVALVALDNPFSFAHKLEGEGACRYTVERVVTEVVDFVKRLRAIHPGVVVGSIEQLWSVPATEAADMEIWLDTYEEISGEPFAFLHIDTDWTRPDWPELALEIEAVADARGVPFSLIYMDTLTQTDDEWLAAVASRMTIFEEVEGGTPDHVVFQSWVDHPDRLLPDDDPSAFTSLINRYLGDRTLVELEVSDDAALAGTVMTTGGDPVARGAVQIEATPLSGVAQTVSVSGTAPENAESALVVMRLNSESAVVGDASVLIHDVGYAERGTGVNLVPNPEFAQGLAEWGVYGEPLGSARITATEEGNGRSVLMQALADQVLLIDGVPFPITPGAEFEFRATLSVPEGSFEHGSVAVVFLENLEVARTTIPFLPVTFALGTIETDGAGAFARPLGDLNPGGYKFRAVYFGDDRYWMSWASVVGDVTG